MKVEYVDHMGTDLSVVNAARVSFDKESDWDYFEVEGGEIEKLKPSDVKLLKYLSDHNHWTPFAHTAITLRMQAPVPITVQCFKHKQGFVENGESRRYVSTTPQLFIPESFRSKPEGSIKQGSGGIHPKSEAFIYSYVEMCDDAIMLYEDMIREGVCPEQARFVLPQGIELQWMWTGSLSAYARFYNQRTDPHAQKEIQDLAHMVGQVIEPLFPESWKVLTS